MKTERNNKIAGRESLEGRPIGVESDTRVQVRMSLSPALRKLIKEIEDYWRCHVWWAVSAHGRLSENAIEIYKFSRGENSINPKLVQANLEFDENLQILDEFIPGTNEKVYKACMELDSLKCYIAWNSEEVGYFVGVLMGAKLMGATHEQLEQMARNLQEAQAITHGD